MTHDIRIGQLNLEMHILAEKIGRYTKETDKQATHIKNLRDRVKELEKR